MEEGRVLDDERVGLQDRLAEADRLVIESGIRDNRGPGPLGTEAGECLGEFSVVEGGNAEEFCRGYDALAAAAMNS